MKKIVRVGLGITLALAVSSSSVFAQVTIQPVPPPKPGQPGGPSIQPPRPVRPQPPRPPRPKPPKPVKPRPPHHNLAWIWLHQFRPPHSIGWNQALLYSGPYGSGNYVTIRESIPDLKRIGFNDRAHSIYTSGTWMVCTRTNYRGSCATYRGRQGTLGHLGGDISSIRFMGR